MVERTIKSNRWECDQVQKSNMRYLMRQGNYRVGETFHLQCYEKGKPVLHISNKQRWVITMVVSHLHLPIEKGYCIIAFKEI